jgi:hypothetical protein
VQFCISKLLTTYELIAGTEILLEKLMFGQLVKLNTAFHRTLMFIAVFQQRPTDRSSLVNVLSLHHHRLLFQYSSY